MSMYFPNRLELSFFRVLAFPKACKKRRYIYGCNCYDAKLKKQKCRIGLLCNQWSIKNRTTPFVNPCVEIPSLYLTHPMYSWLPHGVTPGNQLPCFGQGRSVITPAITFGSVVETGAPRVNPRGQEENMTTTGETASQTQTLHP